MRSRCNSGEIFSSSWILVTFVASAIQLGLLDAYNVGTDRQVNIGFKVNPPAHVVQWLWRHCGDAGSAVPRSNFHTLLKAAGGHAQMLKAAEGLARVVQTCRVTQPYRLGSTH